MGKVDMGQTTDSAAPSVPSTSATVSIDSRRHRAVSIALILALSFGGLTLVAVGTVLTISLWTGRQNTLNNLKDEAVLTVSSAVARMAQHLEPSSEQLRFLGDLITYGPADLVESPRFVDLLTGALAATPQIDSIVFIDTEFRMTRAVRGSGAATYVVTEDRKDDPAVRAAVSAARKATGATWGEPVWLNQHTLASVNLHRPVRREGTFLGVLGALVSLDRLSDFVAGLEAESGNTVFILYDLHYVLAHSSLSGGFPGLSKERPLPTIDEIDDPVMAAMWESHPHQEIDALRFEGGGGHIVEVDGEPFVFMHREITDYGEKPWLVGSYFHAADFATEMRRLMWAGVAGVAVLLVAIGAAVMVGRRIARPIRRLAGEARRIGDFDFATVSELPGSRFEEINDAAGAFNAMLRGLRWFEAYVPRTLVKLLVGRGEAQSLASVERKVTVLFTDIAGFTSLSQTMPAAETADFLNHHFALVTKCVEAEGGTVDKYIGDSVMAFWGAPEIQHNHAERACQAALAVSVALKADNESRKREGKPPVRTRIGVHTGEVVVGNIGAPGRINYTIVGDTVNAASRLEQLCKEVCTDLPEVSILISDATAATLGPEFALACVGEHHLRGRHGTVEVYRLL
jgi:class 3 adenylate cyclase